MKGSKLWVTVVGSRRMKLVCLWLSATCALARSPLWARPAAPRLGAPRSAPERRWTADAAARGAALGIAAERAFAHRASLAARLDQLLCAIDPTREPGWWADASAWQPRGAAEAAPAPRINRTSTDVAWRGATAAQNARARAALRRLARDPCVRELMRRHRLRTGCLAEMTEAERGYNSSTWVSGAGTLTAVEQRLGFNQVRVATTLVNGRRAVAERRESVSIHLLLREAPGRLLPHASVRATLLHELAHCRFGGGDEHDLVSRGDAAPRSDAEHRFRAYEARLKRECAALRPQLAAAAADAAAREREARQHRSRWRADGRYRTFRLDQTAAQRRRARRARAARRASGTAAKVAAAAALGAAANVYIGPIVAAAAAGHRARWRALPRWLRTAVSLLF